jgi:catechol 2,3-dioxygenase-like lactoylglutathione lyase family enzyme
MNRFHVHLSVKDLAESIRFYSKLFGAEPSVTKSDYAKWMLDDPRINFAISERGHSVGVNHLGFQVDSDDELGTVRAQIARADIGAVDEKGANCCYARSDKYWVEDPQGIAWETFHSLGDIPIYGEDRGPKADVEGACCTPLAVQASNTAEAACCVPTAKNAAGKTACCE